MPKIKEKLKSNSGEMGFKALFAFLIAVFIFGFCFEVSQRYITAECVKQTVYNALLSNQEDNYSATYHCMRECGEGSYAFDSTNTWNEAGNAEKVYEDIADVTGGKYDGNNKVDICDKDGNVLYEIKDIEVDAHNPSLDSDANSDNYYEKADFTLVMPFFVAGDQLPNLSIPMETTAKYSPRY